MVVMAVVPTVPAGCGVVVVAVVMAVVPTVLAGCGMVVVVVLQEAYNTRHIILASMHTVASTCRCGPAFRRVTP